MGRLICVVGNSGVGKTSLARRLCQVGPFSGGLEQHEERPFYDLFANDPQRYALANQVDFLLMRAEQELRIREDHMDGVQDGGLEMDFYVFTRHFYDRGYLDQREFAVCQRLYGLIRRALPQPDAFVYMTAPLEVIAERFARRGRELDITRLEELQALQALLDEWMGRVMGAGDVPVILVDASQDDPDCMQLGEIVTAQIARLPTPPANHLAIA